MGMLRIVVDRQLCQGHGVCTGESPVHFRLDDKGSLEVIKDEIGESERSQVEAAVKYCPTSALRIVEE